MIFIIFWIFCTELDKNTKNNYYNRKDESTLWCREEVVFDGGCKIKVFFPLRHHSRLDIIFPLFLERNQRSLQMYKIIFHTVINKYIFLSSIQITNFSGCRLIFFFRFGEILMQCLSVFHLLGSPWFLHLKFVYLLTTRKK